MATEIPLSDYLAIENVAFEWVNSYDQKDWARLQRVLAPTVTLDFRGIKAVGTFYENISSDEFVGIVTKAIGSNRLKTQHFIGAKHYERLDNGRVRVRNQMRVAHQLYGDDGLTVVRNKGHGHGVATNTYQKIDGGWKLVSTASTADWSEFDLKGTLTGKENLHP